MIERERIERMLREGRRPRGYVRMYRNGRLWLRGENLWVNSGLPALASLLGGDTAGEFATIFGAGSGNTAPTVADTALGATPAYYNALTGHSYPSSGSIQFDYELSLTDYGAIGTTIQEIGIFANSASATFPAAVGTANPAWAATNPQSLGDLIVDSNGNIQRCTTPGTTGSTAPAWGTTVGATTSDGGALVWTLVALHTAPATMLARKVVSSFAFDGTALYQGTWTFTF